MASISKCLKCGQNVTEGRLPVCLECGDVPMCKDCCNCHLENQETKDHTVTGTCEVPGHEDMPLERICTTCSRPLCARCPRGSHRGHDVGQHSVVIAAEKATLGAIRVVVMVELESEEAEQFTKKDEKKKQKDDEMQAASNRFDDEETTCAMKTDDLRNSIHQNDTELKRHQTESEKYHRQIEKYQEDNEHHQSRLEHHKAQIKHNDEEIENCRWMLKRHEPEVERHRIEKERLLAEKARKVAEAERIGREREETLKKIANDYQKDCIEINARIKELAKVQKEIKDALSLKDELVAEKILRPGLYSDIKKLKERLKEMGGVADGNVVTRGMEVAPGVGRSDVVTGGMEAAIRAGRGAAPVTCYSSGKRLDSLDIPGGVKGIIHMTCDCIVACGGRKVSKVWEVWMWMLRSKTSTVIMQTKVTLIGIAALGKDDVVVLTQDPKGNVLRIVNMHTRHVRSINVEMEKSLIEWLWEVEVDDHGRFLITCGKPGNIHLVHVDRNGSILHDIQTRDQYFPTFCRLRGMAVICSPFTDLIKCYKLQDGALTEVIQAPHGVQGFKCNGICSGSSGEIFITGLMRDERPWEARVYQAEINAEEKTVVMKRIRLDTELRCTRYYSPRCAFHENTLSVYSNDHVARIDVFCLSP